MMKNTINEEMTRLMNFVREKGGDATPIMTDKIRTGKWVRMKCLFGCNGFGRRFSCPPYTPTSRETQEVLNEYSHALLVRFDGDVGETTQERWVSRDMTRYVQTVMSELEEIAFQDGFYKALGYTGHQCGWCVKCAAKEKVARITDCKNRKRMRPSMEAAGIDVYATCRAAGWELKVLECSKVTCGQVLDTPITTVMLLLVE
ncbi:MAG TPA: DUF2284 domain-containing protein [Methanocorpusculum sp.]|nr:DUF2284 domain-containing protein [Methanocorpusculum sp.]